MKLTSLIVALAFASVAQAADIDPAILDAIQQGRNQVAPVAPVQQQQPVVVQRAQTHSRTWSSNKHQVRVAPVQQQQQVFQVHDWQKDVPQHHGCKNYPDLQNVTYRTSMPVAALKQTVKVYSESLSQDADCGHWKKINISPTWADGIRVKNKSSSHTTVDVQDFIIAVEHHGNEYYFRMPGLTGALPHYKCGENEKCGKFGILDRKFKITGIWYRASSSKKGGAFNVKLYDLQACDDGSFTPPNNPPYMDMNPVQQVPANPNPVMQELNSVYFLKPYETQSTEFYVLDVKDSADGIRFQGTVGSVQVENVMITYVDSSGQRVTESVDIGGYFTANSQSETKEVYASQSMYIEKVVVKVPYQNAVDPKSEIRISFLKAQ